MRIILDLLLPRVVCGSRNLAYSNWKRSTFSTDNQQRRRLSDFASVLKRLNIQFMITWGSCYRNDRESIMDEAIGLHEHANSIKLTE